MGDAVLGAFLGGDELGKGGVTHARGAEGEEVDGDAGLAQVGGGDGRGCCAEGVAGCDDSVGGVGFAGRSDGVGEGGGDLEVGGEEARVKQAAGGYVAGRLGCYETGWTDTHVSYVKLVIETGGRANILDDPVPHGDGTPERNDD